MEDEPPEQINQSFIKSKTLVFSFDTEQKQSEFICELFSFKMEEAHFSLDCRNQNSVSLTIFSDNQESIIESEDRINEIVYNLSHEKNKWWFWKRH